MSANKPGIAFEKAVAEIQSQIDPAAKVSHNEIIEDRLGQKRQFDVVVRGMFAGQPMLGIIECKDFKRKVGTPEVDAFVTKAQDVNANFKLLISSAGFSAPALDKCKHYGIQALSLVDKDPTNRKFFIGMRWEADITRWNQLSFSLHFVEEPNEPVHFEAGEITIKGKRILDWFTNYLLDNEQKISGFGWVVNLQIVFDTPQSVCIRPGLEYLCKAITLAAERVCDRYEKLVGISGIGFLNWNTNQVTFPPGEKIVTDAVPMDFTQWQPRSEGAKPPPGFLEIRLIGQGQQFDYIDDVINMEAL